MIKKFVVVILCFLLTGCFPGVMDFTFDLPNDYILCRSSGDVINIVPTNPGWKSDEEIIPEKVIKLAWNERYVGAMQYEVKRNEDFSWYVDTSKAFYWIMDTQERKRMGPFTLEEYEKECVNYGLQDLELKSVNYHKYRLEEKEK